jgi:hypothetical protein
MILLVMLFIPSNGSNGSDVRENQKSWRAWVGISVNNGDDGSSWKKVKWFEKWGIERKA